MTHYREVEGNLIEMFKDNQFDIIAHGCNCQKLMSGGLALQISKELKKAHRVDLRDKRSALERFGDSSGAHYPGWGLVVNLYTQFDPGPDFDINALSVCLKKLNIKFAGMSIGLPQIGCGIGGGSWYQVCRVIQRELKDMNVTIVKYKPKNEKRN